MLVSLASGHRSAGVGGEIRRGEGGRYRNLLNFDLIYLRLVQSAGAGAGAGGIMVCQKKDIFIHRRWRRGAVHYSAGAGPAWNLC